MRKKSMAMLLCLSMGIVTFAGCEKTPEDRIVREKGADSIKEYESATDTKTLLRDALSVPEHYKNEGVYENGGLVIDTDADVIVPKVSTINTYAVSAKEVNQDLIDRVTKVFFDGDKIYQGYSYHLWTKEDYQNYITTLKRYKAEGNLDPYDHGTDENGELQFQIDDVIAKAEENLKSAPEEVKKEEVTPALNLEYWNGKGEERVRDIDYNHFSGVAETENGKYNYIIDNMLAPEIVFSISKIREDLPDRMEFSSWTEGEYVLDQKESSNYIPEETLKQYLNISYEEAERIAKEKIEKLGWDLRIYGWDYGVFCHGEAGVTKEGLVDAGYLFHFSRELEGVPITYTASYGGALEDMDSTLEPWGYEKCDVIVGDDGIWEVKIYNPYDIGEVKTENVKLMDFDSILKIYEQMMEIENADIGKYEKSRTYHIKKITLGYSRIYDSVTDNDTGLLVPVWDFFGGADIENLESPEVSRDSGEHSTRSYMTINAIDGSVIDRELGY